MNGSSVAQYVRVIQMAAVVCLLLLSLPVFGDESELAIPEPGFRPDSEHALEFLNSLDTATIAVYPTIVRRAQRTAHSFASQRQVINLLEENNLATTVAEKRRIDLGKLVGRSQWDLFQSDMQRIAENLESAGTDADYRLVMEFLLPQSDQDIFGIQCYVLDQQGNNAFSFLLNSHHALFRNANLAADGSSEAARAAMMERATQIGVTALMAQVERAREDATGAAGTGSAAVQAGLVDDFESGLASGTDGNGIPIGIVTFGDKSSVANISTTAAHPPLQGDDGGDSVLQLDLNVTGWAGFMHVFENDTVDRWASYDWSAFDTFSFWLYGNNSGTSLFVDVLDNRKPCSADDDAERYVYAFIDDFSGWRRISVPFSEMVRKEIGNEAPNDGLGLSEVHGWAFGTLNTGGPATYYIDDFALRSTATAGPGPVIGAGRVDYPINELPMYGLCEKTAAQKRADENYITYVTSDGRSRAEAAGSAARSGWNAFYDGDCATAIKRFNQAWLLDPENQLALWGFAVISVDRDQLEDAVRFFQMAAESGPEQPMLRRDYDVVLARLQN